MGVPAYGSLPIRYASFVGLNGYYNCHLLPLLRS